MTEIKTIHVWMLDGRSLCDRRAQPSYRGLNEDEYVAAQQEAADAPACGACLLLAGRIRREASAILERHPVVEPARASAAWESLRLTRWGNYFDLNAFADNAGHVDGHTRYDAVNLALDKATVTELVRAWDEEVARTGIPRDQLGGKGPKSAL